MLFKHLILLALALARRPPPDALAGLSRADALALEARDRDAGMTGLAEAFRQPVGREGVGRGDLRGRHA